MTRSFHAAALSIALTWALLGCAYQERCGLGECAADAKVTTEVKSRLSQYPELGLPDQIEVQTHNRVVYLSGFVSAGEQSRTAEDVARGAAGVKKVVNTIAVTK